MKLTVQQVYDATLVVSQIIREQRSMPQKGKLRLARLHMKLLPEFKTIDEQRDALIKVHGNRRTKSTTDADTGVTTVEDTDEWEVPAEHMAEFNAAWKPVAEAEIEVDVQPIPLSELDGGTANGVIEAAELITLGDLISE